jgi:RND family efflux transporter MFP subunit
VGELVGRAKQVLLSLAVLAGGAGVTGALYANRPVPGQASPQESALPVDVLVVQPGNHSVRIESMGVVQPVRQVTLQPEVSGRVTATHPNLVPGGHVRAGDVLIEVDGRDYRSAVAAQQAAVAAARVALAEEKTSQRVADYEWRGKTEELGEEARAVALRRPHVDSARAGVSSAQDQLGRARRNLKRTHLIAPFDAVVLSETVDFGQVVSPQTPVTTLAGTDRFWIEVSLPVSELRVLKIPGVSTAERVGSTVQVLQSVGEGEAVRREGQIERLMGAVDDRGKLARILVTVSDPFGLQVAPGERPLPLLIGTYVDVVLEGIVLADVTAIPATALLDGDHLWIVVQGHKLERRQVKVAWRGRDEVVVESGLSAGEQVVVSALSVATEGMEVWIREEG